MPRRIGLGVLALPDAVDATSCLAQNNWCMGSNATSDASVCCFTKKGIPPDPISEKRICDLRSNVWLA